MNLKNLFFLLITIGLFTACSKEDPQETIDKYIADNNLDAQSTDEGLYYVIEKEGTGKRPVFNSDVKVHYEGSLTNGSVFDGNLSTPISNVGYFNLTRVISGWQLGIPLFKEGGEGLLIIPPDLGYGSNPPGGSGIPKNAVLVFEVKLLDVR